MKKFFASFIAILFVNLAFAGPIDQNAAYEIANAFIQKHHPSASLTPVSANRLNRSITEDNTPYYYIFNIGEDNGFVIVSSNENEPSILGYADQGAFDPDNVPDGLALMLNMYEEQLQSVASCDEVSEATHEEPAPRHSISLARNYICPLDSFFFFSTPPYNYFCPTDSTGTHVGSGCTAAAMSQIMAYWQYPPKTTSIPGYSTDSYTIEDIPSSPIDWPNILRNYSFRYYYNTPDEQIDAIASLMYKLAVGVKTDFGGSGGSLLQEIIPTFVNYFGYSPDIQSDYIIDLGMNKTEDIIYNELVQQRLVLMYGARIASDPSQGAHMWVIDGYDHDALFHINWGWNGHMNGFFRLSAISPYHHEMVWNYMKNMIIYYNIKPLGVESHGLDPNLYSKRACTTNVSVSSTSRTITTVISNALSEQYTFEQGLNIYSEDGQFIETFEGETVTLAPGETSTFTYSRSFPTYASGNYILRPVSRLAGETEWQENDIANILNAYVRMFISASKTPYYYLHPVVQVNSVEREEHGPVCVGAPQIFKMNVTNNSNQKFGRWINLYANDALVQVRGGHIPANSTTDLYFGYEPTEEGSAHLNFTLALQSGSRAQSIANYDLEVGPVIEYGNLSMDVDIDNLNADNDTLIHGNTFRAKIKITNNGTVDYHDYVNFILRYNVQLNTAKPLVDIPAGESVTLEYEFNELEPNCTYRFTTYYKKRSNADFTGVFNKWYKCYAFPGYRYWTADGKEHAVTASRTDYITPEDAVAVSFMGNTMQPTNVVMNNNPNTIYYVTGPYYAYLNDGNVVRGLISNKITINEDYPFYVPLEFTAKEVTYTRNFAHGFGMDGTNWSTITLPFQPYTVTDKQTGKEIDWFHTSNEVGKDFWIREFYAEDGNKLYFKDAEEFKAYRPYIIAVPDDTFGEDFDLTNRDIEFKAEFQLLKKSKPSFAEAYNYEFEGTMIGKSGEGLNCYLLNEGEGGNAFLYTEEDVTLAPFHAMFTSGCKPNNNANGPLRIVHFKDNEQTGIAQNTVVRNTIVNGVYTLDGRKIAVGNGPVQEILQTLPKGIYIINGHKYVK